MIPHMIGKPRFSLHLCGPWGDCGLQGLRLHVNLPSGHLAIGTPMQLRDRDGKYRDRWGRISWVPRDRT